MSDRLVIAIAGMVLAVCLVGAAAVTGVVQQQRDDLGLIVKMEGVEGIPPHVAVVTAALGTFRGLAVDVLWARAEHLQDEGEFYEAQTLSEWITTLQPRFQKVWGFQAWNMAWNIAAATQVPAERWGWVRRGMELLRTKGIPLNPNAPNLYFELAWIFQNKIGRVGDAKHWYYKARLAGEMQEVLGDLVGGRTTEEAVSQFRRIAEAPDSLEELKTKRPAGRTSLDLLAAHGAAPDEATLRMLGRVLMATSSVDAKVLGIDKLPMGTNIPLLEAIKADSDAAARLLEDVIPYLQKRVLEDRYRMDTDKMLEVMERYGPLDWRHPQSHAIYWSERGVEVSRNLERRENVNELMLVRGRLLMLMELLRSGRVEFDPMTNRVDLLPDPRFARVYEMAIREAFDLIASDKGVTTDMFGFAEESDLFDAYEKFLNIATMFSYLYGDEAEAKRYFTMLRDLAARRGVADQPVYADTLENFVAMRFGGMVGVNLGDLRQVLDAMIRRAITEGLAAGDYRTFNRFLGVAHAIYDRRYAVSRPGDVYILEDTKLVEFPKLVSNSFANIMRDASVPVLARSRIWTWAPDQLKSTVYQAIAKTLAAAAEEAGLDPARAFPEPKKSPDDAAPSPAKADGDAAAIREGTTPGRGRLAEGIEALRAAVRAGPHHSLTRASQTTDVVAGIRRHRHREGM